MSVLSIDIGKLMEMGNTPKKMIAEVFEFETEAESELKIETWVICLDNKSL